METHEKTVRRQSLPIELSPYSFSSLVDWALSTNQLTTVLDLGMLSRRLFVHNPFQSNSFSFFHLLHSTGEVHRDTSVRVLNVFGACLKAGDEVGAKYTSGRAIIQI